jgi:exopolysaccharide biosynthesis polyprenyl glycosylphosphotransferase
MQNRVDNFDAFCALLAALCDAIITFAGFLLAVWIRFSSGWIPLHYTESVPPFRMYLWAASILSLLLVFTFRQLRLYKRPQFGHFADKIPRLVRGLLITFGTSLALASVIRIEQWPTFSRTVFLLAFFTVLLLVGIERNLLFQLERHLARHSAPIRDTLVIGTSPLALRLRDALHRERRLRTRIIGFLSPDEPGTPHPSAPPGTPDTPSADDILGSIADLPAVIDAHAIRQIILADSHLSRARLLQLYNLCEQHFIDLQLVPDLYGMLTTRVTVSNIGDIPLLTMSPWPLDSFHNRLLKRTEDIIGSLVGLLITVPVVIIAAPFIKRSSPGPVFYRQTRLGRVGRPFVMYKLRTMPVDAEAASGPVWTSRDDNRRTRVGAFLRRWNLDELPQFWNVLKGEMSLVGPRPERPFFVDQFKDDIGHYMARHTSRPGMTGWAQVNGLRGNTSIRDRLTYDLYYLENWSLSFDIKILLQTFISRQNAY